ncbi:MAG: hypothetical protein U1E62_04685 [Alsobacter sp.]
MAFTSARALVAATAFALIAAAAPTPSMAQDGLMGSVMGMLGLGDDEKPEIDYRERAPLVVPPTMTLRAPEQSLVDKTPNWPQDPDVQRRKQIEAQKKLPGGMTQEAKRWQNGDRSALGEMQAGRGKSKATGIPEEQNTFDDSKNKRADWLNPATLAAESRATELAATKSGVEPDRRYLTDPPSGYRKPSQNAEYKAPKVGPKFKEEDSSPLSLYKKAAPEEQ